MTKSSKIGISFKNTEKEKILYDVVIELEEKSDYIKKLLLQDPYIIEKMLKKNPNLKL